ncbi:hypothetical protein [Shinella sp. M31]|uniref:hypothetical protein n=1 Tax=Shinella sp. M31 TaxID=3368615 RepID=UPI003BA20339
MSRWIRVQTSIFDHELFATAELSQREAWLWLIANVAWKETRHRIGNEVLDVPVGSMFVTLRSLQSAWRWGSDKRVRTFLSMLESERMIETKTDAGKTQITVCNYSRYQDVGRTEDASGTQAGRSADALKTPVHQDTNTSSLRSDVAAQAPRKRAHRMPDDFSPDLDFAVAEGMTHSQAKAEADAMRDWSRSSPNGAKLDWPATWRGWVRRALKDRPPRQSQAPPRKSAFQQHQDDCQREIDRVLGRKTDDEFTGNTLDLGARDYRAH